MENLSDKTALARRAEGEALWELIRLRHPAVTEHAVMNRHLTVEMAESIVSDRKTPAEVIGLLLGDGRFKSSSKLKLMAVKNPRCPMRIAVSLLKHIRIFDLGELTKNQYIRIELRRKIELMIAERIPSMPSGVKITLARGSSADVVMRLMEHSDLRVIEACLDSPYLSEDKLIRLIRLKSAKKPQIARAIAAHPIWSLRYAVRMALIRCDHAPLRYVEGFLTGLMTPDLQELYHDPKLPTSTRHLIHAELALRKEEPTSPFGDAGGDSTPGECEYEVDDEEVEAIMRVMGHGPAGEEAL